VSETGTEAAPVRDGQIKRHGPDDFAGMRKAGQISARALDMLVDVVKPGVTTQQIDDVVREFFLKEGAAPATLFYRGYTKSSCTSINHVVCHGIPNDKALKDGDIVNIDVTCIKDGWHGDTSRMYPVGEVRRKAERLVEVTYQSMMRGIEQVKPGNTFGDIGRAIQEHAEAQRFSIVRDFCGHGLGRLFHDAPNVLHFDDRTHAQRRQGRREGAGRRLDRGDPRQDPVRSVRALGGRHRRRGGDLHQKPARPGLPALLRRAGAPPDRLHGGSLALR